MVRKRPGPTPLRKRPSRLLLGFGATSNDLKQGKRRRSMWPRRSRWVNLLYPSLMLSSIPTVRCPSRSGECMPIAPTTLILLCGDHSRHKLCSHNWVGASRPTNNIRESVRFITLKSSFPVILRNVPPRTPQRVNFITENECCVCLCGNNLVKARRNKNRSFNAFATSSKTYVGITHPCQFPGFKHILMSSHRTPMKTPPWIDLQPEVVQDLPPVYTRPTQCDVIVTRVLARPLIPSPAPEMSPHSLLLCSFRALAVPLYCAPLGDPTRTSV